MNKIEAIKTERDGLAVKEMIAHYAKTGWESIPEDDVQRLKWYGLFLRNPTPGFFMIRVRIPGGKTGSYQLRALAAIAGTYGNGLLDLTTRQQLQLRQIRIEDVPAVFAKMEEVGLTSLQTGMDNVRGVMTCPVAGLSPDEVSDATPIVRAITEEILGNPAYTNLPRKFNVAVTGCPDNCVHMETQDLALVPASHDDGHGKRLGYNVLAGGKLGSGGYRVATPLDIFVTEGEALDVSRAIIQIFREHGSRENRTQARLAFLLDEWGESRFREEVETRVGKTLSPAGVDARKPIEKSHVGIYRQVQPGMNYVGLKVLVGRVKHDDLAKISALAEKYGTGEIRISPAQALIIPNVSDRKIGDLDQEPLVKQFAYNPSPLYKGLVSCVGNDYCNLAVIETKSRAVETAKALEARLGGSLKPITMHWSGCPAACGNHQAADIGFRGMRANLDGQIVDAVAIYTGGKTGPDAVAGQEVLEVVRCDEKLPEVVANIIRQRRAKAAHLKTEAVEETSNGLRQSI